MTPPSAGRDVEQQEPSFIAGGMQTDMTALGDSLAVSYETKHALTTQSSNHAPWDPYINLHMNGYNSFAHDCLNSEAAEMFSSRRLKE